MPLYTLPQNKKHKRRDVKKILIFVICYFKKLDDLIVCKLFRAMQTTKSLFANEQSRLLCVRHKQANVVFKSNIPIFQKRIFCIIEGFYSTILKSRLNIYTEDRRLQEQSMMDWNIVRS